MENNSLIVPASAATVCFVSLTGFARRSCAWLSERSPEEEYRLWKAVFKLQRERKLIRVTELLAFIPKSNAWIGEMMNWRGLDVERRGFAGCLHHPPIPALALGPATIAANIKRPSVRERRLLGEVIQGTIKVSRLTVISRNVWNWVFPPRAGAGH